MKQGDSVCLKTYPDLCMMVLEAEPVPGHAECFWFSADGKPQHHYFPIALLEPWRGRP